MALVSLPDMAEPMRVHAELSDVDDGRIAVGMAGTCTLDAYPGDPIACTVKELSPVARTKGETSLRRAFSVELDLGKTDAARMRPGVSVKVELRPRVLARAVVVPRSALVTAGPSVPVMAKSAVAPGSDAPIAPRPDAPTAPGSNAPTALRSGAPAQVRMVTGALRDVKLGACDAQVCAVEAGLVEGDAVVIGGVP
jgi:hypothetical protein